MAHNTCCTHAPSHRTEWRLPPSTPSRRR